MDIFNDILDLFNIDAVFGTLRDREEMVLRLYYLGENGNVLKNIDIADRLGISSSRVYQIRTRAIKKLRHPTRSRRLLNGSGN